jgi:Asp-tRNA(Asn)/Glu-tRNA(Gln) amidotransferase A subunit family amidase
VPRKQFSDPYTRWRRASGERRSAADYIRAAEVMFGRSRETITQSAKWDCLLASTITVPPPRLATFLSVVERTAEDDLAVTPFTLPLNITGQPAISLPLGRSADGLPIGVQLVGRLFDEATLFSLAAQIERAAPWGGGYPAPLLGPEPTAEPAAVSEAAEPRSASRAAPLGKPKELP